MKDLLLHGESNVNNILESLRKKLGLRRPQLAPFAIMMVDKWKVQLIGFIRNLKIDLVGYVYSIIVLNMEHGIEGYSMLLVKPWLKYAKAHHNWGDNTFTITLEIIIVTFSTVKHVNVKSSTNLQIWTMSLIVKKVYHNKKKKNYIKCCQSYGLYKKWHQIYHIP